MSDTILQDFCPVLRLDSDEKTPPCSFKDYTALCSLHRVSDGSLVAAQGQFSLTAHADDADLVLVHDGAYPRVDSAQPEVLPSVPVYGRMATFVDNGSHKYALGYLFLWPFQEAASASADLTHACSIKHLRVVVDRGTRRLEKVFFCGAGHEGDGAWLDASQLKFDDHARRRPLVYVAEGTHGLYPSPGFAWRVRGALSDTMDGGGQVWRHSRVQPLPGSVLAFAGRLAQAVPPLKELPVCQVTVEAAQPGATEDFLAHLIPLRTKAAKSGSHPIGHSGHVTAGGG